MEQYELEVFNSELLDEIDKEFNENLDNLGFSPLDIFTDKCLNLLKENEKTEVFNAEVVYFQKEDDEIQINAFAFNSDLNEVTFVISLFSIYPEIKMLGKEETRESLDQCSNFYNACVGDYFTSIDQASDGYKVYMKIQESLKEIKRVNIIMVTNKLAKSEEYPKTDIGDPDIIYDVWDLKRLYSLQAQQKINKSIDIILSKYYDGEAKSLPLIKSMDNNSKYDCYVGVIPGNLLARIYQDKGQSLMDRNIRAYLSSTGKINKEVKKTLKEQPEMFMAYNNGISTIADSIVYTSDKKQEMIINVSEIYGWQIVNGGQTTVSLYNAYKEKNCNDLANVSVQLKLTVLQCDDKEKGNIIDKIALYANSQNPVKASDFSSNKKFHTTLHELASCTEIPSVDGLRGSGAYWYYENSRGEYNTSLNRLSTKAEKTKFKENNKKFSKTEAAIAWMLMCKKPWYPARGGETNFVIFQTILENGDTFNPENPVKIPEIPTKKDFINIIVGLIIYKECNKIILRNKQKYTDWKAPHICYSLALLYEYNQPLINVDYVWQHQTISGSLSQKIEELIDFVWGIFIKYLSAGRNLGQACKKEEFWEDLKNLYLEEYGVKQSIPQ